MKVKFMALHFHYNRGQGNARPSPRLWSEEEDYDDDGDQKLDWKNENIHFWYLVSIVAGLSTHSLGFCCCLFGNIKNNYVYDDKFVVKYEKLLVCAVAFFGL